MKKKLRNETNSAVTPAAADTSRPQPPSFTSASPAEIEPIQSHRRASKNPRPERPTRFARKTALAPAAKRSQRHIQARAQVNACHTVALHRTLHQSRQSSEDEMARQRAHS